MDGTGGSLAATTLDGATLVGDRARPDGVVSDVVVVCHPRPNSGGDHFLAGHSAAVAALGRKRVRPSFVRRAVGSS